MKIVIQETGDNNTMINHAAFLLVEYFTAAAGGQDNFELSNWSRLDDIVTKTLSGRHTMFVAYADGVPAGVAGVSKHGELQHLYVKPEYRGFGIAQKLVEDRLAHGAWFAVVDMKNTPSAALMQKCGLVESAQYKNYRMFAKLSTIMDS